jgi:hypothetical protein
MRKIVTFFLLTLLLLIAYRASIIREYQFDVNADSILIYDGDRYVGSLACSAVPALDSLIIEDNR